MVHPKGILLSQFDVANKTTGWHSSVYKEIKTRIQHPNFPCVFAKGAFRKGLLKFVFAEGKELDDIQHVADGLAEYVELNRNWDRQLSTAYPLLVAFSRDAVSANTVEDYYAFGWEILQILHELDPGVWPDYVAKDPENPSWAMCYAGMPLFINMSTPMNILRKSRNLGKHMVMVINPRERFDVVAGDNPTGRKIRANVRNRIRRYDGMPPSSYLGFYQSGALEWCQYGLPEKDIEKTDKCPFVF